MRLHTRSDIQSSAGGGGRGRKGLVRRPSQRESTKDSWATTTAPETEEAKAQVFPPWSSNNELSWTYFGEAENRNL